MKSLKLLQSVADGLTNFFVGTFLMGLWGGVVSMGMFDLFGVPLDIVKNSPTSFATAWVYSIVFSMLAISIIVTPYSCIMVGVSAYNLMQKRRAAHVQH